LPNDPGSFCAALLSPLQYDLPQDVHEPTWQVALRHFAQARPTESQFRRLLERRTGRRRPDGRDPGARVAAFLLREWELYGLARLLGAGGSAGGRRRGGWQARRSVGPPTPQVVRLLLRQRAARPG
jgi:hypothetical protein